MATTEEYLNKLVEDKDSLKQSFADRGVDVSDADTFTALAAKASELPTGGSPKVYEFNLENTEENLAMFNTIYKEYMETGIMPVIKVNDPDFWYENCNSETYYEEGYCGRFIIRTYYGDFDNDYDFQDENRYTIKLSKYEEGEEHEDAFSGIDSIIIKRGMRTGFIYKQEHSPMQNRSMALSVEVNDGYKPLYKTSPATKEYVDDSIDRISSYKTPNVIIVGEPTIQDTQVSNFTADNYLMFPYIVDFDDRPFEIDFSFTTGEDITRQQNILDSEFGLAFAIRDGKVVFVISENGTSWAGEHISEADIGTNTTYAARIIWDTHTYRVELSDNDGVWYYTTYIEFNSTAHPYPKTMYIGNSVSHTNAFAGSVNLKKSNLLINDEVVWSGVDSVPFESKLNIDLSNIDDAGKEKIKELAGGSIENYIETTDMVIYYSTKKQIELAPVTIGNSYTFDYTTIPKMEFAKEVQEAVKIAIEKKKKILIIFVGDTPYANSGLTGFSYLYSPSVPATGYTLELNGIVSTTNCVRKVAAQNYSAGGSFLTLKTIDIVSLGANNTSPYTPTLATHPATKGYVDTAIANYVDNLNANGVDY